MICHLAQWPCCHYGQVVIKANYFHRVTVDHYGQVNKAVFTVQVPNKTRILVFP